MTVEHVDDWGRIPGRSSDNHVSATSAGRCSRAAAARSIWLVMPSMMPPHADNRRRSMLLSFCWGWLSHPAAAE
ncbi:hypothetical protein [Micromonospora sp. CB01531]|uniref:hypothetical protein n=1 Tax=Micromonospora sp. CB01531 TaxID=1718947 RepID=UPI00093FDA78|nr:hypothetical protein [Micromonospora sp. CB01531]OKI84543.1 hypothetical protein A6A27_40420 [Micromonospora sp. CB01531]